MAHAPVESNSYYLHVPEQDVEINVNEGGARVGPIPFSLQVFLVVLDYRGHDHDIRPMPNAADALPVQQGGGCVGPEEVVPDDDLEDIEEEMEIDDAASEVEEMEWDEVQVGDERLVAPCPAMSPSDQELPIGVAVEAVEEDNL